MPPKHRSTERTGSAPVQRWIAHGFTRGVITLPNGPLDLGDGWSLHPDNDAARSQEPVLILESPNTMAQVGNPHEWSSLRLMGIVEATTHYANSCLCVRTAAIPPTERSHTSP